MKQSFKDVLALCVRLKSDEYDGPIVRPAFGIRNRRIRSRGKIDFRVVD